MLEVQPKGITIHTSNLLKTVDGIALMTIEFLRLMSLRLVKAMVELVIRVHTLCTTEWLIIRIDTGIFTNQEVNRKRLN